MDFAIHFLFSQEKKQIILYLAEAQRMLSNADSNKCMSFSADNIFETTFSAPANADWFLFTVARDTFY